MIANAYPSSAAAEAPASVCGSPTIATSNAVPSTAPIWRNAEDTALATPKRAGSTSVSAAAPKVGNASPIPKPASSIPGSQVPT